MRYETFRCSHCGATINNWDKHLMDYNNRIYCSTDCKWDHLFTEDCSRKGSRPKIPGAWYWASTKCFRRDDFTCQKCGVTQQDLNKLRKEETGYPDEKYVLNAHHIRPVKAGGTSLPENLITLCFECHKKSHPRQIMRGGNNKELFDFQQQHTFKKGSGSGSPKDLSPI